MTPTDELALKLMIDWLAEHRACPSCIYNRPCHDVAKCREQLTEYYSTFADPLATAAEVIAHHPALRWHLCSTACSDGPCDGSCIDNIKAHFRSLAEKEIATEKPAVDAQRTEIMARLFEMRVAGDRSLCLALPDEICNLHRYGIGDCSHCSYLEIKKRGVTIDMDALLEQAAKDLERLEAQG